MKIVSVMTTHTSGGAEFAAMELLDSLAARGHDTITLSNQPEIGRDTAVTVRPIDLGPKLSVETWPGLVTRTPQLIARLGQALRAELPFDVLLVHYKKEQLLAGLLPRRLAPRIVWAEWGPIPFQFRRGLPRTLYRAAARRVSAVMAVSAGTQLSITEVGVPTDKVALVPNVMRVDELRFSAAGREAVRERLGIPPTAFVVGCISRFHPKKRNDVVVDATVALGDPNVHLLMAGDGETEADLRKRASPLGDRAHFVPTPGCEVAEIVSAFDVSVFCPSPTEGTPRAVILAMLAGRACISTGAEWVRDLIPADGGCILSPENDPAALRTVLSRYRDDETLRSHQGKVAEEFILRTYDPQVIAAEAERILFGRHREPRIPDTNSGKPAWDHSSGKVVGQA